MKSLDFIKVFEKKVAFYNHQFKPKRACGITCVELRPALDAVETPPRVIAHPNGELKTRFFKKLCLAPLGKATNLLGGAEKDHKVARSHFNSGVWCNRLNVLKGLQENAMISSNHSLVI